MAVFSAFAPANISCLFRTRYAHTPAASGSFGIGVTLEKGVTATADPMGPPSLSVNGEDSPFPTVADVISALAPGRVAVTIAADLPFGAGFGMSGASALGTAFALNAAFGLNRSPRELAMVAHIAEVTNGTGLGDVAGQLSGGWRIRITDGDPLSADRLHIDQTEIFYRVFGSLETKGIIGDAERRRRIDRVGASALERIRHTENLDFKTLTSIAKAFAIESGLLTNPQVMAAIEEVEAQGGGASMIMLGEAIFSNIPFSGSERVRVAQSGARMI